MPSNVSLDAAYTASLSNNFQLNTNYNYTKLFLADIAVAAATSTIYHNLGYRPQVITWIKTGSTFEQCNISGYAKVNNSTVIITAPSNDIHYRIYLDGQL